MYKQIEAVLKWREDFNLPSLSQESAVNMVQEEFKELVAENPGSLKYYKELVDLFFVYVQLDVTLGIDPKAEGSHTLELIKEFTPMLNFTLCLVLLSNYSKRTKVKYNDYPCHEIREKDGYFYYYNESGKLLKGPEYKTWDSISINDVSEIL